MPFLNEISRKGGFSLELVLSCYQSLCEQIYEYGDSLTKERRRDLLKGLREHHTSLMEFCLLVMFVSVPLSQENSHHKRVVKKVLHLFQILFEHINFTVLTEESFQLLFALTNNPEFQAEALEAMISFVTKKRDKNQRLELNRLINGINIYSEPFYLLLSQDCESLENDSYLLINRFAEYLKLLTTHVVVPGREENFVNFETSSLQV
ncbi:uncharacterized protein LOC135144984 [Zophobas morio]|uniref:uncharacterized protein LOC135144984 n=1 Tax=Zophobas morio TaxID=2755281 RepID=UPI0030837701